MQPPAPKMRAWAAGFLAFVCCSCWTLLTPPAGWPRSPSGPEVRRVGLSKVGENTLLTVMLNGPASVRIITQSAAGKPRLVVEFPQAWADRLPRRLPGDDLLVEQVTTETGAPGGGVRVVLDLFPERPYAFWRRTQPGAGGQSVFILGLKPDQTAPPVQARMAPSRAPEPEAEPPSAWGDLREREPEPTPGSAGGGEPSAPSPRMGAGTGSFAEIRNLMPKAGPLLQALEREGWTVADFHNYDRPGQRFSRDFTLLNRKYPQLVVKIVYLPANTPDTPNIGIVQLSTEKVGGEAADKYQNLRQWSFGRIKQDYEDIGDFFDDALKPLRVKLREETKALALRDAAVFQNFLKGACPQNPQVAEQVMSHVREKVNPRFEGVQYTVSEDPLVILNLVDFLNVKVYFLESR